jgi:hypothetical protein
MGRRLLRLPTVYPEFYNRIFAYGYVGRTNWYNRFLSIGRFKAGESGPGNS